MMDAIEMMSKKMPELQALLLNKNKPITIKQTSPGHYRVFKNNIASELTEEELEALEMALNTIYVLRNGKGNKEEEK